MEWRYILLSTIDSLAWPTAAVVIVLLVRRPLFERLPTLSLIRYRDFDARFRDDVERVFERLDDDAVPENVDAPADWEFASRLASVEPTAAVKEAWHLLDFATARIDASAASPTHNLLAPSSKAALRQLRALRDRAMQAPTAALTIEAAEEYVEAAFAAWYQLSPSAVPAAQSAR